jgi:membrane protease YdiL (CAAX protease family)
LITEPWLEGRGPLGFLPSILFADRRPVLVVILAFVLTIAGSFVLGSVVTQVAGDGVGPDLGKAPPVVLLIGLALVSPLIETLLMGGIIDLLRRWIGAWQAAVASAAIWGVLHSLLASWWGAVIWWPFLIFSIVWLTWRPRGFWIATALVTSVHVLQNLGPAIAIALDQ